MNTEVTAQDAVNLAIQFINTSAGSSGAEALARVLLHAHDPGTQILDIRDIGMLDPQRESWAWAILKARSDRREPKEFVHYQDEYEKVIKNYWKYGEDEAVIYDFDTEENTCTF